MPFPILPVLFGTLIGGSLGGLAWYLNLSKKDQEAADIEAAKYAKLFYKKGLSELSKSELDRVYDTVKFGEQA